MIPDIEEITKIFDHKPDQIEADKSFDFTCFAGFINGAETLVFANQSIQKKDGSPMSRIEAISRLLDHATNKKTPIVWIVKGIPSGSSEKLAFPPQYPDFFVGKNGSGSYLKAIFKHRLAAPQIAIVDQEITSSRALGLTSVDLVLMHSKSAVTIGRPSATWSFTHHSQPKAKVLGIDVHKNITGLCAAEWTDFSEIKTYLTNIFGKAINLPVKNVFSPPTVPSRADSPFDIRFFSKSVFDSPKEKIELWKEFAPEIVCEIGRINGFKFGVLSNNSIEKGGFITIESIKKMSRFHRLTERLKIPTLSLVDCAGLFSDTGSESAGIFESAGDLLTILTQKEQDHVCAVLRRAYSSGLYLMGGGSFCSSKQYALPTAKFSIYGPSILRKEIQSDHSLSSDFSKMLDLHDNPKSMEMVGNFEVISPENFKRKLVF